MHFTLVFHSYESEDLSISICFVPCAAFVKGKEVLFNPHPEYPEYRTGDIRDFISEFNIRPIDKNIAIIIHPGGHGQQKDLDLIVNDLSEMGYSIKTVLF
jgi:hypothetical protein